MAGGSGPAVAEFRKLSAKDADTFVRANCRRIFFVMYAAFTWTARARK